MGKCFNVSNAKPTTVASLSCQKQSEIGTACLRLQCKHLLLAPSLRGLPRDNSTTTTPSPFPPLPPHPHYPHPYLTCWRLSYTVAADDGDSSQVPIRDSLIKLINLFYIRHCDEHFILTEHFKSIQF